ncbi:hypothetical protein X907_2182 [Glycocaulis alkaliphilus]|uniref:Uncharacterized protein n=1 Tax=Glycocaulis alkaliphilus TaxID=1434191 RepID=A0A3T0EB83_9PROT|nr:hypothetical protein X907_2182 [Glycocaulis alkaliphilus]
MRSSAQGRTGKRQRTACNQASAPRHALVRIGLRHYVFPASPCSRTEPAMCNDNIWKCQIPAEVTQSHAGKGAKLPQNRPIAPNLCATQNERVLLTGLVPPRQPRRLVVYRERSLAIAPSAAARQRTTAWRRRPLAWRHHQQSDCAQRCLEDRRAGGPSPRTFLRTSACR